MCARCGAKFTDERWEYLLGRGRSWGDRTGGLCGPCLDEHFAQVEAERVTRRQAEEAERAAAEAPAAKPRSRFGIRRRR
ncbi:hypothetical protein ABT033_28115 [Streptomyces pharetrae]|uniref:hypothetical protein n=1 Tax=Streptomyces pharetrae TaxID=291370 RepID=UPI0033494D8E